MGITIATVTYLLRHVFTAFQARGNFALQYPLSVHQYFCTHALSLLTSCIFTRWQAAVLWIEVRLHERLELSRFIVINSIVAVNIGFYAHAG